MTLPYRKVLTSGITGAAGCLVAYIPSEVLINLFGAPTSLAAVVLGTTLWTAAYGFGLCLALIIGQNRYLHRPWLSWRQFAVGSTGGAFVGCVSGAAAEVFFQIVQAVGARDSFSIELSRIVAWGLFGAMIGFGSSFVVPNLGRTRGLLGGAAGGVLGALGFIACGAVVGDFIGRLVGMMTVGFAIGALIAIVEAAFRTAWLEIRQGVEVRTVNLGPEPVSIGSDARACTVYVRGAPSRAFRYWLDHGKAICEDLTNGQRNEMRPGEAQALAGIEIRLCTGTGSSQTVPAQSTPRSPTPPPPPLKRSSMPNPVPVVPAPPRPVTPPQPMLDRPSSPPSNQPAKPGLPLPRPPRPSSPPPRTVGPASTPGPGFQAPQTGQRLPPPLPPPRRK